MPKSLPRVSRFQILSTIVSLGVALSGVPIQAASKSTTVSVQKLLKTYASVLSLAENNYADESDSEKMLYDSIRGMLQTLDPHSNFFDPKTYRLFRDDQRGNFFGLGISIGTVNGQPTIMAILAGTPAQRVGLRSGDIIIKIDGGISLGLTRDQVVERLRGPKGSFVRVSIQREGVSELLDFSVNRDVIPQHSVALAFPIRPKLGYLRIDSFTETTEQEIESALANFGSRLEGLVLDLRSNPGGSLQAAIGVADKFLKRGQSVLITKGRLSSANQKYVVPNGTAGSTYPMVILINNDSASAAEIVAGAIQDHDRGLIAGETSFGKGLVQSVFDLSRGTGVALTTAKWYTPSGRLIQRDYTKKSFFDYFNGKGKESRSSEIKYTDSGRAVYGGGGITPDVVLEPQTYATFQSLLLAHAACFTFIRSYNVAHAEAQDGLEVTDKLMQEFRAYLDTKQVLVHPGEFEQNSDFIRRQLRYEYALSRLGLEEAQKIALEGDAQVLKAIDLIPQARVLFSNAEKSVASRRN